MTDVLASRYDVTLTCVVGGLHGEWCQEARRCHGNHWCGKSLGHLRGH